MDRGLDLAIRAIRSLAAAVVLVASLVAPVLASADDLPLTTLNSVRQLPLIEARKGLPVRVRGVVTFSDPRRYTTFIDDGTAGIFVNCGSRTILAPGMLVEASGISGPGDFANIITGAAGSFATVNIIGTSPLPEAISINGAQLLEPDRDCQWVSIEAQIREVFVSNDNITLQCSADTTVFHAILASEATSMPTPWHLLEHRVRMRGVVATTFNRERQMTGRLLRVSSLDQIESLAPAAAPANEPRAVRADDLFQVNGPGAADLVRVQGVATLVLPGRGVFLRTTGGGALWVQSGQAVTLNPGTELEAEGWPRLGPIRPFLRARQLRVIDSASPPKPLALSARAACDVRYDGELVSVEADLLDVVREADGVTLELRDGGTIFRGHLASIQPAAWLQLIPGSRLRVTGIAQVSSLRAFYPVQESDKLLLRLRQAGDVAVLAIPSPWTMHNVLAALGAGGVAMLGGYGLSRWRRAHERAAQRREFEAVLAERGRIAREIHDSLAQGLTSISIQLECVREEVERAPERVAEHVELARSLVRDSLREARRSVWNLRPLALGEADLPGALRRVAGELTHQTAITCTQEVSGTPRPLSPEHESALLRIGQEALTNAVRHAAPRRISVRLSYTPDWVTLRIQDDGCGFDVSRVTPRTREGGFGLVGMNDRVAALSGSLTIDSRIGDGTEVSATLLT